MMTPASLVETRARRVRFWPLASSAGPSSLAGDCWPLFWLSSATGAEVVGSVAGVEAAYTDTEERRHTGSQVQTKEGEEREEAYQEQTSFEKGEVGWGEGGR
jgi:hypothetical protein